MNEVHMIEFKQIEKFERFDLSRFYVLIFNFPECRLILHPRINPFTIDKQFKICPFKTIKFCI